jgi:GGDEF domain-containing protein
MESGNLSKLMEQAARNVPELDPRLYKEFQAKVGGLTPQLQKLLLPAGDLEQVRRVLEEFNRYHRSAENAMRERRSGWRELVSHLLGDLMSRMGVDPASEEAAPLMQRVGSLLTSEEIHGFLILLNDFLRTRNGPAKADGASPAKTAERFSANDNATGLRNGDAAIEHLKNIMEEGGCGYVVHFELSCLSSVHDRFGMEAVQDCVMAVSAFLTRNLRSDDTIFYWSDSSLLAILPSPANLPTITAVIQRIVDSNRDITLQIGGGSAMLRVPLHFSITPISKLKTAGDVLKLYAVKDTLKAKSAGYSSGAAQRKS